MRNSTRRSLAVLAGSVMLFAAAVPATAAPRSGRNSKSSARSASVRSAPAARSSRGARAPSTRSTAARSSRGARPVSTSASRGGTKGGRTTATGTRGTRTQASGHATYGHGGYHGGYYGHGGHYGYNGGYYGYPYGWGWGYGWPWYGYGYGYVAPRTYPVYVHGDRHAPAVVETNIKPKKAEVWLNDEWIGQARDYNGRWDQLYLKPGSHKLEFRRDGHESLIVTLEARAGRRYVIDDALTEGEGSRTMAMGNPPTPAEAAGTRPPVRVAELPALEIESGALARGLLKIEALPQDAAVYLDGDFLASAAELSRLHGSLPVAAGVHVIEVARPGFKTQRREIDVAEGEPVRIEVALDRQ